MLITSLPDAVRGERTGEVLEDQGRPWKEKRMGASAVAQAFLALGEAERARRCMDCGTVLVFEECRADGHKRLVRANFCRERLCPMCAWRRSMRLTWTVDRVLHQAALERPNVGWVMLTLTQRNVPGQELAGEVDRVLRGWRALARRSELRGVWGWLRVLEVTRNPWDGSWHPHLHALLAVRPSYWSVNYVRHADWVRLWAEVMDLDYLPSVEVHRVRPRGRKGPLESAAREVAKYAVKDSDLLGNGAEQEVAERLAVLHRALAGRRLVEFGGWLRDVKRRLRLVEPEDGDLVKIGDEHPGEACPICGGGMMEHVYRWVRSAREYVG